MLVRQEINVFKNSNTNFPITCQSNNPVWFPPSQHPDNLLYIILSQKQHTDQLLLYGLLNLNILIYEQDTKINSQDPRPFQFATTP